jgi:single-stranded DNA-binding protein
MSDQPTKKFTSYRFQKYIALVYVLKDPELKFMKSRREGEPDIPYCTFFGATGAAYGHSGDTTLNVRLRGKNAELFCKEPRKGSEVLVDGQINTYEWTPPGEAKPKQGWCIEGRFDFVGPRTNSKGEVVSQPAPASPKTETKQQPLDGDVPF